MKIFTECGEYERYEVCPFDTCTAKNCSELGFAIGCPGQTQDGSCPGGPGCVCIDGYLRNDVGSCIPQSECGKSRSFVVMPKAYNSFLQENLELLSILTQYGQN